MRRGGPLVLAGVLAACSTAIYRPQPGGLPKMTREQAAAEIRSASRQLAPAQKWFLPVKALRVTETGIVLMATAPGPLKDLPVAEGPAAHPFDCPLAGMSDLAVVDRGSNGNAHFGVTTGNCYTISFVSREAAERFVNAAYLLSKGDVLPAGHPDSEETRFAKVAQHYRAADPKPALPEEARRHRVLAEHAVSEKRFDDAVDAYAAALAVAPWWPEGHFNKAIIQGELQDYADAIRSMRCYLALVPQAPDARAARDRIYLWEGLANAH